MRVFFILGREPAISLAEIFAILSREFGTKITQTAERSVKISTEALILELPSSTNLPQLMDQLGGTIKIGIIEKNTPHDAKIKDLAPLIAATIQEQPNIASFSKVHFGVSIYRGSDGEEKTIRELQKAKSLGMEVKRMLKEKGHKTRWVTSAEPILSSVIVETNKLLREGNEIVLITHKDQIEIGYTIAVQPFRELEKRDFTRPGRDAKSGMLPPKLARMLVNLTAAPRNATLLDPFCGSGTVLAEALLLGYSKVLGADIDPLAIKNTQQNLEWLTAKQIIPKTDTAKNIRVIESDITDLTKQIDENSIDAIATEMYLGPPQKGNEPREKLEDIHRKLTPMFESMLRTFNLLLKKDGRAIIAFPLFRYKNEVLHAPILKEVETYGYALIAPLPEMLIIPKSFSNEFGIPGKTLIYGRDNQRVWREIAIIRKI